MITLPKNGRITIIDDRQDEAAPLMRLLSKNNIPFNYYSGTRVEHLPDEPNKNKLRVLFLDLNIFELNKQPKDVISSIHSILKRIIPDNPNPYLLIIWSKQTEDYLNELKTHFKTKLPKKSPAKIIFLQKSNYFDFQEDGSYLEKDDCLDLIRTDLSNNLEDISILRNFIEWENLVHESSSEVINRITSFHSVDDKWDRNTKGIIYELAKAVIGRDRITNTTNKKMLANALLNFNGQLSDGITQKMFHNGVGEIDDLVARQTNIDIKSHLNTFLHTLPILDDTLLFETGNLFILRSKKTIQEIISAPFFKERTITTVLRTNPLLVKLDITPVCDYSQDKSYIRTLLGIAISSEHLNIIKADKKEFHYHTPVFRIRNTNKFILFDFRYTKMYHQQEFRKRNIKPSFKMRQEIVSDIQVRLASQLSRLGIVTV